ncbi:MAG: hypothetical protein HYY78_01850 [Betaproteobacteria bacterium]|nr:hypothetical protein [Betaproteobacteria bacterium]
MKKKLNLETTQLLELIVEGKPVRVRIDAAGNPITLNAGCWIGGDDERIAKLALATVRLQIREATARRHHATRTQASTSTKRDRAADFWGDEWLAVAHLKHPDYRADRLAQEARRIIALNGEEKSAYKKRKDITVYRAKQYLKNKDSNR